MPNPYVILAIVGVWVLTLTGAAFGGWHERAARVPAELAAQSTTDGKECEKVQQLTKDANDALQKNRDTLAAQLSAYKLRHPPTCVRVASSPQLPSGGPGHAPNDGDSINTGWLIDYASTCEQYRSEVTSCVSFLAQERQLLEDQK